MLTTVTVVSTLLMIRNTRRPVAETSRSWRSCRPRDRAERARDQLARPIGGTTSALISNDDAAAQVTGTLDALREGLVEVRQASNPEIGPGTQGYP